MSEKCFCHIKDKKTGEIYVVKDKELREGIEQLRKQLTEPVEEST